MKVDVAKIGRKVFALVFAIVLYYIIHEGAHLIFALCTGSFEKIVFMFPGVQIKVNIALLTSFELGILNLLGAAASLTAAYVLYAMRHKIASIQKDWVRAIFYYSTIMLLLNDPIYLSILCDFFGGGDMNGISLLMPEQFARIAFGAVGVINIFLIFKAIVPTYRKAFEVQHCRQQKDKA